MPRLRIQQHLKKPVVTIRRGVGGPTKLVYVAVANKALKYRLKKSPIVYIGTTSRGLIRILESAGARTERILSRHGVKKIHFFVVTCTARQKTKSWELLERALILRFRELHGDIPLENTMLKNNTDQSWEDLFDRKQLDKVLSSYKTPSKKGKSKKSPPKPPPARSAQTAT